MQNKPLPSLLVADDEDVIRNLFERILCKEGYMISMAIDGLDALNKIKENDYDMLILDLKMPGINGMEVINKIKELKKEAL